MQYPASKCLRHGTIVQKYAMWFLEASNSNNGIFCSFLFCTLSFGVVELLIQTCYAKVTNNNNHGKKKYSAHSYPNQILSKSKCLLTFDGCHHLCNNQMQKQKKRNMVPLMFECWMFNAQCLPHNVSNDRNGFMTSTLSSEDSKSCSHKERITIGKSVRDAKTWFDGAQNANPYSIHTHTNTQTRKHTYTWIREKKKTSHIKKDEEDSTLQKVQLNSTA